MSSSVSPISSLSAYSGLYFSGMSNYSQDLNNAISREVQIASLPIQQLQNNVNALSSQASELQTLQSDLSAVQSAVSGIGTAAGSLLSATLSNYSVANATVASNASAGSYSLEVDNLGSYSNALSIDGLPTVTDPGSQSISTSGSYTLTVNGQTIQPAIQPQGDTLNALAQAINNANAGVQATVVNVGNNTAPDYRLSLESDTYGDVSMQLNDGSRDLLAATGDPGQPVQYIVNGKSIQSDTRSITLAQGLTMTLTGTNVDAPATVTVAPNTSSIGNALRSFISAYNTAVTEINKNLGQGGGALAGQSIVYELMNTLQGLANFTVGGSQIPSLAALGVNFNDTTGQLSFDQDTFNSATSGQVDALTAFLGSATGGGFLQTATSAMTSLLDPDSGILTGDISSVQSSITSTDQQISTEQDQVNQLQTNLINQMSAADALIYSMQQQATYFQQMFLAQQAAETAGLA
ncbi:MAG TPA: flagellar filament capping protein FliD [Bryobacteraceae bacterium]|nr:flagellar filament capping protein FliD [Bryobacteraceae bacterium]